MIKIDGPNGTVELQGSRAELLAEMAIAMHFFVGRGIADVDDLMTAIKIATSNDLNWVEPKENPFTPEKVKEGILHLTGLSEEELFERDDELAKQSREVIALASILDSMGKK